MLSNTRIAQVLVTIMGILLLATIVWPLQSEKDKSRDNAISADLSTINYAIESYYSAEDELPGDFGDIDIETDVMERAVKYHYELDVDSPTSYELCAVFKTNTTDEEAYDMMSTYMPENNPYIHDVGEECFRYTVYQNYYNSSAQPQTDYNFDSWLEGSAGSTNIESGSASMDYSL